MYRVRQIVHRAFERFTEEGPIALLPQDAGYSMVWCCRPEHAAATSIIKATQSFYGTKTSFGDRVGQFLNVSPRFVFALVPTPKPTRHDAR